MERDRKERERLIQHTVFKSQQCPDVKGYFQKQEGRIFLPDRCRAAEHHNSPPLVTIPGLVQPVH